MRAYIVDELNTDDIERFQTHVASKTEAASMGGIYWLNLPEDLLSTEQAEHAPECGPHAFGIEIGEESITLELLVRARGRMRCSCVTYADAAQRAWGMDTLDGMFEELDIPV
ncbi:hypothetical protein [Desulfovibrio ferrophilus]|uniref:Uncharacterized protein n=1 Tax=Desulfovibrio ferrophilus TaxID=241368 RepID=A0A2Z6AWN1_9BACT|nr:hypothetical protein [Desulfovibrio ferrophilus]BBD07631.1 uncharacterized protein DFE_0905 [Desulfovibrio ferrophilus]